MIADLAEDPGIPHSSASDHQTPCPGLIKHDFRITGSGDISIGQYGTLERVRSEFDQIMPDAATIHL